MEDNDEMSAVRWATPDPRVLGSQPMNLIQSSAGETLVTIKDTATVHSYRAKIVGNLTADNYIFLFQRFSQQFFRFIIHTGYSSIQNQIPESRYSRATLYFQSEHEQGTCR